MLTLNLSRCHLPQLEPPTPCQWAAGFGIQTTLDGKDGFTETHSPASTGGFLGRGSSWPMTEARRQTINTAAQDAQPSMAGKMRWEHRKQRGAASRGDGPAWSSKERDIVWSRGHLGGFPGHSVARSACGRRLSCSREGRCYRHLTDETLQVQEKEVMDSGGSGGPCPCSGRLSHVVHMLQPACHLASKVRPPRGPRPAPCPPTGIHTGQTTHSNICLWIRALLWNIIKSKLSQPRKPVHIG